MAVDDVLGALGKLGIEAVPDWVAMGPAELVDHLESTHHRYLHSELPRLDVLAEKVASVHGERHPELLDVLADVKDLRDDLEPHLAKEERVLFPMIRQLCRRNGPVVPLRLVAQPDLHDAHRARPSRCAARAAPRPNRRLQRPARRLRQLPGALPGPAELESDTHLHVHKENNLLFPAVVALEDELSRR